MSIFKKTSVSILITAIFVLTAVYSNAQATAKKDDNTYTVEYYYKVKWGYQAEFISLFKKNHYPILKKQMEMGRIMGLKGETPVYHGTEGERWDYRITITFKSAAVAFENFDEEALKKQLFPDQATYTKEEQRRFEILLAHWDLPIKSVTLDEK